MARSKVLEIYKVQNDIGDQTEGLQILMILVGGGKAEQRGIW